MIINHHVHAFYTFCTVMSTPYGNLPLGLGQSHTSFPARDYNINIKYFCQYA